MSRAEEVPRNSAPPPFAEPGDRFRVQLEELSQERNSTQVVVRLAESFALGLRMEAVVGAHVVDYRDLPVQR